MSENDYREVDLSLGSSTAYFTIVVCQHGRDTSQSTSQGEVKRVRLTYHVSPSFDEDNLANLRENEIEDDIFENAGCIKIWLQPIKPDKSDSDIDGWWRKIPIGLRQASLGFKGRGLSHRDAVVLSIRDKIEGRIGPLGAMRVDVYGSQMHTWDENQ